MSLTKIFRENSGSLEGKGIKQIIAFAGDGALRDGNETSEDVREYLTLISSEVLARHVDECMTAFTDSGMVLQDLINEIGRRLGFRVTNGRYRGHKGAIGNDGLWVGSSGLELVIEVKTTDAYRIDLNTIANYARQLKEKGETREVPSVLIVVGRTDTGDLEAQIRGSKHAWDMRLISVDGLVRLMLLKESLDDPKTLAQIHQLLLPREFTKLDEIVDLVFSTAEDAMASQAMSDVCDTDSDEKLEPVESDKKEPKFTPVAFNAEVAKKVSEKMGVPLLKRSRATFSTPDDSAVVICSVSKEYNDSAKSGYWFAFHPHQKETLENSKFGYVALGCGSPERVFLIPIATFVNWLPGMNMTEKEGRSYWHVQISGDNGDYLLIRKQGQSKINLNEFLIQDIFGKNA